MEVSYRPRLLYSAALLHTDQAALYRAMKALRPPLARTVDTDAARSRRD